MGKRGPKPKGKVKLEWSANFAYAIGLIVSDGNVSQDGRHVIFTSKDEELVKLFTHSLNINISIGMKASKSGREKKYFITQFSDVLFYQFLLEIGITPNKSLTVGEIKVPERYFIDFLRGSFDGDGCTYSYWDPRWKSSFMFYTTFVSASQKHVLWLQTQIEKNIGIKGHVTKNKNSSVYQLKYAKADSLQLLRELYKNKHAPNLTRKRLKIESMLSIVGEHL